MDARADDDMGDAPLREPIYPTVLPSAPAAAAILCQAPAPAGSGICACEACARLRLVDLAIYFR